MQLCMYRTESDPQPHVGVCTVAGVVYEFSAAVEAGGHQPIHWPADILEIITGPDELMAAARAATSLGDGGEHQLTPVAGASLTVPFPKPRRDAFAIGGNYRDHVVAASATTGLALTERKHAVFFMKPTGAFNGPYDPVRLDAALTQRLDYEVELGVVLGRGGRDIDQARAMSHVFGFLVVNDFSARDIMLRNKPQIDHFRGKGLDTFFPMGPGVTLRQDVPDYKELRLTLRVNGETRQDAPAGAMIRDVAEIIAELSKGMSLHAGDIISTGTPAGVQQEKADPLWLQPGDVVESEITGLGVLRNEIQAAR